MNATRPATSSPRRCDRRQPATASLGGHDPGSCPGAHCRAKAFSRAVRLIASTGPADRQAGGCRTVRTVRQRRRRLMSAAFGACRPTPSSSAETVIADHEHDEPLPAAFMCGMDDLAGADVAHQLRLRPRRTALGEVFEQSTRRAPGTRDEDVDPAEAARPPSGPPAARHRGVHVAIEIASTSTPHSLRNVRGAPRASRDPEPRSADGILVAEGRAAEPDACQHR